MTDDTQGPVAVQQTAAPVATRNELPPVSSVSLGGHDPALDGFYKIAAERRARVTKPPLELPFGDSMIRVHSSMPAGFAFDAAAAEVDPYAAKNMLRSVIVEKDLERFDAVMKLPPDNPEAIDGSFLMGFIEQLSKLYAAIPLGS